MTTKLKLSAPFTAKQGYLNIVCFYEGIDHLLQLFPKGRFFPQLHPLPHFLVGEAVELPDETRMVESVEPISSLEIKNLNRRLARHLQKYRGTITMTASVIDGYRYKLMPKGRIDGTAIHRSS